MLYELRNDDKLLAINVSYDVVCAMQQLHPETITYKPMPVPKALVKYEICFSTPPMNRASAHDIIERCVEHTTFPGYTVFDGAGSYQGQAEPSYTFSVVQGEDDASINNLASVFKATFCQQEVLVIKTPVTMWSI